MTFEKLKNEVLNNLNYKPEAWRRGQFVFNYIEEHYGDVARQVQFLDHVDCFYRDELIDDFLRACANRINTVDTVQTAPGSETVPGSEDPSVDAVQEVLEQVTEYKKKKKYAVMLFNNRLEIEGGDPRKWVNTQTLYFDDGGLALHAYANIPNPASQLIDAYTEEELEDKIKQMIENFKNQDWLNENLYPYI